MGKDKYDLTYMWNPTNPHPHQTRRKGDYICSCRKLGWKEGEFEEGGQQASGYKVNKY